MRRHGGEGQEDRSDPALVVFVLAVVVPGMALSGFLPWELDLDYRVYVPIAAVGGALAGIIMQTSHRLAATLAGAVAGGCALYATHWYLEDRESVWTFEFLLPLAAGCLPGLLVYFVVKAVTGGGGGQA